MDLPDGFEPLGLGAGFSSLLGPVYVDRAGGRLLFRPDERHANPVGTVHGGAIATFADAQVAAVRRGAESGRPHHATISLSVDYIAPAVVGCWLEMRVELVKLTRTMVFTQATILSDGAIAARSTAIYHNKARTTEDD